MYNTLYHSLAGHRARHLWIGISATRCRCERLRNDAIWSALQKMRDHEDIAAFTPAQITSLASKHSLPFGRAMPSEGLSIDQMCQAIQAVGLSPNLLRIDDVTNARAYLHSAVRSAFAPVVILKYCNRYHAVAVAGMKLRIPHEPCIIQEQTDDLAGDLIALYVHDDRRGPYLRANLQDEGGKPKLCISSRNETSNDELWDVTHIIIPMHPKIRLSFSDLRKCGLLAIVEAHQCREFIEKTIAQELPEPITFQHYIVRSHKYIEDLITSRCLTASSIRELCTNVPFPRYVGVIRLAAPYLGKIDLLVDTTSTLRNGHFLSVLVVKTASPLTRLFARFLSGSFRCEFIA